MKNIRKVALSQVDLLDTEYQDLSIDLLKKSNKNKLEIEFLMKAFSNLKFFQEQKEKLTPQCYSQLIQQLEYLKVPQFQSVVNYGEEGTTFNIIIKGEISVLIPKPAFLEEIKSTPLSSQQLEEKVKQRMKNLRFKDLEEFRSIAYSDYAHVRTMVQGESFGEISLITKQKRTATILCNQETHFAVLHKHAFDRILGEQLNAEHRQKMHYFHEIKYFSIIPEHHLNTLVHQMIEIRPKMNEIIYKENDPATYIYFMLSGEVELSLTQNKHKIVLSLLTQSGIFGEQEILENTDRVLRAVNKSRETIILTMGRIQFIHILEQYNILSESRRIAQKVAQARMQQLYLRKQATQKILNQSPQTYRVNQKYLTPEISRLHSHRSTNGIKKSEISNSITNSNCLIPIEIPKFIRIKEEKYYDSLHSKKQNIESTHHRFDSLMKLKQILQSDQSHISKFDQQYPQFTTSNNQSSDTNRILNSFQFQPTSQVEKQQKFNKTSTNIHMIKLRSYKNKFKTPLF